MKNPSDVHAEENEYKGSLAERALKRRRLSAGETMDSYIDMRCIVPTSNMCERLFSKAGYTLNDRRQGTLPANFEAQMFLHANCSLWGPAEVAESLKK